MPDEVTPFARYMQNPRVLRAGPGAVIAPAIAYRLPNEPSIIVLDENLDQRPAYTFTGWPATGFLNDQSFIVNGRTYPIPAGLDSAAYVEWFNAQGFDRKAVTAGPGKLHVMMRAP